MQNFVKNLNRNLSDRQLILDLTKEEYIKVTVVQHEEGKESIVMIDDKKYDNSGFKGGIISSYGSAVKDLSEILYDVSKDKQVLAYSSDFLGKVFVDVVIPDKYNYSCFREYSVNLDGQVVDQNMIDGVCQELSQAVLAENTGKVILHSVVCNWEIDGNQTRDPIGLQGNTLKCFMHYILIDKMIKANFEKLFQEKELYLRSILPRVCLDVLTYHASFSQRTMLLSLEQGFTTFIIVIDGDIVFCGRVEIGYWHIVNDLVAVLNISVKQAIEYINEYGVLYDKDSVSLDEDKHLNKKLLYDVIFSRVYELLSTIKKEYIGNMIDVDRICLLDVNISGIEQCVEKVFDNIEVLPVALERYNHTALLTSAAKSRKSGFFARMMNYIFN